MLLHDPPADGESEPMPAGRIGIAGPIERLKDAVALGDRNPDSLVAYAYERLALACGDRGLHKDRPTAPVLQRVVEQVAKDPREGDAVALDPDLLCWRFDLEGRSVRTVRKLRADFFHEQPEIQALTRPRYDIDLEPCRLEEIRHQQAQRPGCSDRGVKPHRQRPADIGCGELPSGELELRHQSAERLSNVMGGLCVEPRPHLPRRPYAIVGGPGRGEHMPRLVP